MVPELPSRASEFIMKGVRKCVLELLKKGKPFTVTAPDIWLTVKEAESLKKKGLIVTYKNDHVKVEKK